MCLRIAALDSCPIAGAALAALPAHCRATRTGRQGRAAAGGARAGTLSDNLDCLFRGFLKTLAPNLAVCVSLWLPVGLGRLHSQGALPAAPSNCAARRLSAHAHAKQRRMAQHSTRARFPAAGSAAAPCQQHRWHGSRAPFGPCLTLSFARRVVQRLRSPERATPHCLTGAFPASRGPRRRIGRRGRGPVSGTCSGRDRLAAGPQAGAARAATRRGRPRCPPAAALICLGYDTARRAHGKVRRKTRPPYYVLDPKVRSAQGKGSSAIVGGPRCPCRAAPTRRPPPVTPHEPCAGEQRPGWPPQGARGKGCIGA